ncbi:hypothetical protein EVAR_89952_1 [Eumeta japonica]|uniref:Uncharacterized protein n=1 Tax=Eumeta variegata TaxID=151549 RepID=A0A4C2AD90_EUMVA|nr:hypothetical protein EVAR_89952_1 [Eumeta japonica]
MAESWDEENGGELYRYFPDVSAQLSFGWVWTKLQLLTGHGCFRRRLCEWDWSDMLSGIKVLQVGPVYYADLVGTQANFRFVEYARAWHGLRPDKVASSAKKKPEEELLGSESVSVVAKAY